MVNGNCSIVGCTNSRYKLKKWEKQACEEHHGQTKKDCPCKAPFTLHWFPSVQKNLERRTEWIRLVNRTTKRGANWTPGQSDMICSNHFVDGKPTKENPAPTINLGYQKPAKIPRRKLIRESPCPEPSTSFQSVQGIDSSDSAAVNNDHAYCQDETSAPCYSCQDKNKVLTSMANEISKLNKEKEQLASNIEHLTRKIDSLSLKKSQKPLSAVNINTDKKMRFYTGIQTVAIFNILFSLIKPSLPKIHYWRGKVLSTKRPKKIRQRQNKLCGKDQLLLVLVRLRLGLLNQDLADRFNISEGTCSIIFSTWIKFLSKVLGNALIVWLPKDVILENLPDIFKKKNKNTRCVIDCSEVYIERPKSLDVQACTWSDYKKHNTFKFLIAVSPAGYIMFLSDCYGGRTTDQYICQNSGFYDLLEPHSYSCLYSK